MVHVEIAHLKRHDSNEAAPPRRFEFVHNAELRPVVAQAFADSRRAFDEGDFRQSLILSCSVLEAVITDALMHRPGHRQPR